MTSIEDQFRNCERLAEREGWDISDSHYYADKAQSGSLRDRVQYKRMLKAAEAGEFNALIVDDLSRLSRDDVELKTALKRLRFRGVRMIGVSDGFDSAAKGHKVAAGVRGLMNELYLDDLREKTRRGLEGQFLKGHSAGGRPYGYR